MMRFRLDAGTLSDPQLSTMATTVPVVNPPGSSAPELLDFDSNWFMGTWSVIWSTLPMWKVSGALHLSL